MAKGTAKVFGNVCKKGGTLWRTMKNEFSPLSMFDAYQFTRTNERKHQANAALIHENDQCLAATTAAKETKRRYTLIYDPEMMFF